MEIYYAGIGSRQPTPEIINKIEEVTKFLNGYSLCLRSGGAVGCDSEFERHSIKSEIYKANSATQESIYYASNFHPKWSACNDYVRKLHGRNSMIILGRDLKTPVKFVICYTFDGTDVGGTGLGIRIAQHNKIPVFNLFFEDSMDQLYSFINKNSHICT